MSFTSLRERLAEGLPLERSNCAVASWSMGEVLSNLAAATHGTHMAYSDVPQDMWKTVRLNSSRLVTENASTAAGCVAALEQCCDQELLPALGPVLLGGLALALLESNLIDAWLATAARFVPICP